MVEILLRHSGPILSNMFCFGGGWSGGTSLLHLGPNIVLIFIRFS